MMGFKSEKFIRCLKPECNLRPSSWDQCNIGDKDTHLYSLSWRIPTGSKPWGFWTGVTRFCFCCIWTMEDTCCPGAWGVAELPAIGTDGTGEAWGGAGDGRPLGAGVRCFWAVTWLSPAWPGHPRILEYYYPRILDHILKISKKMLKCGWQQSINCQDAVLFV